ncbi:UDP-N-acetylmuramoyl-tripeptide--D-alanyl-D-alanine ligase [Tengunoibacter tsumagoiensis]|uniref:UDP-N-acetylmuramoyl-tripeptide--D-alanyl-D-alanine ligase n=1 Tax=Tengunoibacter tsumagoiensis TaxID=2014871 RepID=A0A401ZWJ2_9CHLR|nr:UDP-N-acetylmuramoyl-tripeptide--D-alanyl-D-alanine ligase [Tengunoibacter tsumagoiensis]GCE11281.1 UDP-N-acetylmuramoyl-tripeptide--D-alanyl-D-alanine ligase [Tengunoibacter tsumagoiensis]
MFTLNDILQATVDKATVLSSLPPDPHLIFRSAHHDSRQIAAGDLFIAIKGAKVDGHRFISAVAQAGALGALCTEAATDVPPTFIQIVVPDVVEALHAIARVRTQRQRDEQGTTLIGITGSNGKTSTKEAIAAVLSRHAPTLKTHASYNTEIGYPLTLLRLEPQHRYAVLEMGAQWVGELAWLCTIAAPDWSVITNVGTSHLEFFGSQERIAIAKSELVQALQPEGIAILNYDDFRVQAMKAKTQARVLFYGTAPEAHVRATAIGGDTLRGHSFTLHYGEEQQPVQLHIPGEHGITIALAAAAVGFAAGLPIGEIVAALEELAPAKRRGEIKAGPNGSTLIDDSYNANRQSIVAIAQAMHSAQITEGGKRWAVLGDILELGSYSRDEHLATGAALAHLVDYLVAIGEQARFFVEGALEAGMPSENAYFFSANLEQPRELEAAKSAAADLLREQVQPVDLVLLKASLGLGMDTLLTMLQTNHTHSAH